MADIRTEMVTFPGNGAQAAAYLRSLGCPHIGAVGHCMGGGLVWEMAARHGVIDAAAPYYGRPIALERAGEVNVPVEAFYAELDHGIPPDGVRQVVAALQSGGEDADHAFFNDTRPDSYHTDASAEA